MDRYSEMSLSNTRISLLVASSLPMIYALATPQKAAAPSPGAALFAKSCAPCHGVKGEGGAAFPKPLTGSKTTAELSKFIALTMPPGPKKTPPAQAKQIAEFMFGAFYSPLAQERNRPARVTLSRLTVRQFKNAVADLVGDYHPVVSSAPGGLRGEYFKGRDRSQKNRVIERVDPEVKFDFGTAGPAPGQVEAHNYSIVWSGSVYAPDSGEYELIVQTDHAMRLYFNSGNKPLIDALVKSGKDTDYRAAVPLLGGRAYPIRLEFSKATQGVNDDAKKKDVPPSPAFIRLMWRRPKSAPQPISFAPAGFLRPM
jgi:mono/diheme cytochrome c family protein